MQGNGDAAAHVGHDGGHVVLFVTVVAQVLLHGRTRVQGVEEGPAGELRNSPQTAFGQHFIGHRRIGDIGVAQAEGGRKAFVMADFVHPLGDIIGYDGAQVAGVRPVTAGKQDVAHVAVNPVHARTDGGEQAAAGHDDIQVLQGDVLFVEEPHDGVTTHFVLVHHVFEASHFFCGMDELFFKKEFSVNEITHFGGGRSRIDGEDAADIVLFHSYAYLFSGKPADQDRSGQVPR